MRAEYKTEESEQFQRSTSFHWERPHPYSPQAKWQAELGAASVSTPLFHDGLVVIGDNNGNFTAFDADTGKKRWAHNFQLEILRQAAVYKGEFFVGTGAGQIARISNRSKQATALPITTNAVFCPLVIEDGILYYGNQSAELVAFDLEKNQTAWVNKDAQFSIESRPVVSGNEILFTAWDGYLYCLNRENGVLNWRTPGPRNLARERDGGSTTRYYAPADVSPVVAGDRIFLCDRGYNAAIYTRAGEFVADFDDDVSALTASADGSRLFLRRWKKPFAAVDLAGNPLWESKIVLGRLPVEPTLAGNLVLATDNTGTLFAFDQETGAARWRYKITPELFVLGRVEVDPAIETAFAVGMDGVLKAIDLNSLQPM